MTRGLLGPLSPQQEVALRRVAHGSMVVDSQVASGLIALALIERISSGLRLTPLGRLRVDALPKAPLLARQRSIRAMTGFVEALIDKAQARAASPVAELPPTSPPAPMAVAASLVPQVEDDKSDPDDLPIDRPTQLFLDCEHWKSCAERALTRTRRAIMQHRQQQVRLCDASDECIALSRALLKETVPVTRA